MSGLVEWGIFLALSSVAVATAGGMILTMSMYRAGLALMSSFIALAGLFILLDADLLAAIQIMMNVGGMLVMILFMVMLMMDPGGEMMWDMKRKMGLPGPGALSMRRPGGKPPEEPSREAEHREGATAAVWTCPMHPEIRSPNPGQCPICGMDLVPAEAPEPASEREQTPMTYTCPMHPEVRQPEPGECPICGMALVPARETAEQGSDEPDGMPTGEHATHAEHGAPAGASPGHDAHRAGADDAGSHVGHTASSGMTPRQHYQMMVDMAMSTAQLPWALAIGAASAVALIVVVARTAWPLASGGPTQDAATAVGELLLSRYMIGFEGAAFLILAGMVGAVIFAKREREQPRPEPIPTGMPGEQQIYTCPMHPEVRQVGPGQCPICGMDLIPAVEAPAPVGRGHDGAHDEREQGHGGHP